MRLGIGKERKGFLPLSAAELPPSFQGAPPACEIVPELNAFLLQRAKGFERVSNKLEVDLRPTLGAVEAGRGERPCFPYVMLVVEGDSGQIVGHETLLPLPTVDEVRTHAAQALLDALSTHEIRPSEIFVRTEDLACLFRQLCDGLDIPLTVRPSLPNTEAAFAAMSQFMDDRS